MSENILNLTLNALGYLGYVEVLKWLSSQYDRVLSWIFLVLSMRYLDHVLEISKI